MANAEQLRDRIDQLKVLRETEEDPARIEALDRSLNLAETELEIQKESIPNWRNE